MSGAEEWRVVDFDTRYEVSDRGRVRSSAVSGSHRPGQTQAAHILEGSVKGPYRVIAVGRYNRWLLHRLVAHVFFGPRLAGQVVRHLDDNPSNNAVENLAYGTQKQNVADAIRNGLHPSVGRRMATHCDKGHEFTPENTYVVAGGKRVCRPCRRVRSLRYIHKVRGKA